jgi:hypothetical protein
MHCQAECVYNRYLCLFKAGKHTRKIVRNREIFNSLLIKMNSRFVKLSVITSALVLFPTFEQVHPHLLEMQETEKIIKMHLMIMICWRAWKPLKQINTRTCRGNIHHLLNEVVILLDSTKIANNE